MWLVTISKFTTFPQNTVLQIKMRCTINKAQLLAECMKIKKDRFLDPFCYILWPIVHWNILVRKKAVVQWLYFIFIYFSQIRIIFWIAVLIFFNSWKLVRYSHGYKNSHTSICICSYTYKCRYRYFLCFSDIPSLLSLIQIKIQNKILMVFIFVLNNHSSFCLLITF